MFQRNNVCSPLKRIAQTYSPKVTLNLLDWVLRTDANLDGDSLSYMDMLERNSAEERRRERERTMMEEGKALWKIKMDEEKETELRSQQQVGTF